MNFVAYDLTMPPGYLSDHGYVRATYRIPLLGQSSGKALRASACRSCSWPAQGPILAARPGRARRAAPRRRASYTLVLQIERLTRDTTGRVVELTNSVYRGDRYCVTSHLRFDADSS